MYLPLIKAIQVYAAVTVASLDPMSAHEVEQVVNQCGGTAYIVVFSKKIIEARCHHKIYHHSIIPIINFDYE